MVKLKWSITWIPLRLSLEAFPAQITQMPALNFKTRFKLLFFNRSEGQTRSHPCYDLTWTTPSLTLSTLYIAYIYWVGFGGWSIKTVFIEFIFPHWRLFFRSLIFSPLGAWWGHIYTIKITLSAVLAETGLRGMGAWISGIVWAKAWKTWKFASGNLPVASRG